MSDGGRGPLIRPALVVGGVSLLVVAAGVIAFAFKQQPARESPRPLVRDSGKQRQSPSLYCLFSDFTHASVVVGFDFAVGLSANTPRFSERAEAVRNDPAVTFDEADRPSWLYAVDEDGTKTITSPDSATRILLFGLNLGARDARWIEAGIRSNTFRNLDGKCFQSHFDNLASVAGVTSGKP